MLILFDIDGTLLTTRRAGARAMGDAGRDLFGPDFREDGVEYAGRLDPLILADLLAANGRTARDDDLERFRTIYTRRLHERLAEPGWAKAMPGAGELLDALAAADATIGLLTGNFPETGETKLRAAGFDPDVFRVNVWGCDSPHHPPAREHLPEVAIRRGSETIGRDIAASEITIVGDTVHDIACAKAHGCRALGVATGRFTRSTLRAAGADLAASDLTDTASLARWLTETR